MNQQCVQIAKDRQMALRLTIRRIVLRTKYMDQRIKNKPEEKQAGLIAVISFDCLARQTSKQYQEANEGDRTQGLSSIGGHEGGGINSSKLCQDVPILVELVSEFF